MEKKGVSFLFIWVVSAIVVSVIILKIIFPLIFMLALGKPHLMQTPTTLFIWFMIMVVLAALLYATSSDARIEDFLGFLHMGTESKVRNGLFIVILVAFPLTIGYITYSALAAGSTSPIELRIQHPTLPLAYEHIVNPFNEADPETQKKAIEEGRVLFQKNCSPCHGCAADGEGVVGRQLRLKPVNFTDPGTISTVVETYAFWRIKEGYLGLPGTATPWDSAMPSWKNDFTDEEIWKIVMAAYDIADVTPRQLEELGEHAEHKKTGWVDKITKPTDGKGIYDKKCSPCHGIEGDGNGGAAAFMNPRPRDFTSGMFKFRTTPTGELPLDEDLFSTITHGAQGTSMPAFSMLPENEVLALVSYVKSFSKDFENLKAGELVGIEVKPTPQQDMSEILKHGKEIYTKMKCEECHGKEGRGDGPASGTHTDDWGQPILPADLTEGWKYRRGNTPIDVYTTFTTGFNGTPMPSYADTLSTEDRWTLARFISAISSASAGDTGTVLIAGSTRGELPTTPDDARWEAITPLTVPLAGQVTVRPRSVNPSVSYIYLKAIYNSKEIAFLLEWNDRTKNVKHNEADVVQESDMEDTYVKPNLGGKVARELRDAVAVKFPVKIPDGPEKPHFIMGDSLKPINMLLWKADWQEDTARRSPVEELNAKGFNKPPVSQDNTSQTTEGFSSWSDGRWKVVVKRSLVTNDKNDVQFEQGKLIPIAFNVWDGSNGEVGLKMALSSWYYVLLSVPSGIYAYISCFFSILVAVGFEFWFVKKVSKV